MRTSLIIFGVIFLVIGGLLYFVPMQEVKADTTITGNGSTNTRTSTARVTVPAGWSYAFAAIGLVLLILGLAASNQVIIRDSKIKRDSKKDTYDKVVKSKERVDDDGETKHTIVREHIEKHKVRNDGDDGTD